MSCRKKRGYSTQKDIDLKGQLKISQFFACGNEKTIKCDSCKRLYPPNSQKEHRRICLPIKKRRCDSSFSCTSQSDMFSPSQNSSKRFKMNDENSGHLLSDDDEIEILGVFSSFQKAKVSISKSEKETNGTSKERYEKKVQYAEPKLDEGTNLDGFSSRDSNLSVQKNLLLKENMIDLMKTPRKNSISVQQDSEIFPSQDSLNGVDFVPYLIKNDEHCQLSEENYQQNRYGCFKLEVFDKILARIEERRDYERLFREEDRMIIEKFKHLTSLCKTLIIRVFLRQMKFFAPETLIVKGEEESLPVHVVNACLENLCHLGFLDRITCCRSLPDLLNVMDTEDLKKFCSMMTKIDTKKVKKIELIGNFMKNLSQQPSMDKNEDARSDRLIQKLHEQLSMYKILNEATRMVFKKAFHLYSLESMSARNLAKNGKNLASELIFQMYQKRLGQINPIAQYVEGSVDIFANDEEFNDYMIADETEEKLIRLQAGSKHRECAELCYDSVKSKLRDFLNNDRYMDHLCSLPVHLCKFSAFHVFARCLFKYGVNSMQKLKHYGQANECLTFLLYGSTSLNLNFETDSPNEYILTILNRYRGSYYERLVINLNDYMKNRERALNLIEIALEDHTVSEDVRYTLVQKARYIIAHVARLLTMSQNKASRSTTILLEDVTEHCEAGSKLEDIKKRFSKLKSPKIQYETVTIQRPILRKSLGGSRKTIFVLGDAVDVPVEQVAIDYYKRVQNFDRALHDEGACWRFIFATLFFDYIFDPNVPDVWLSSQQTYPLDMHSKGSLLNSQTRKIDDKSLSDAILSLNSQSVQQMTDRLDEIFEKYKSYDCSIDWDRFEDAKSLATCVGPQIVSAICMYLAVDYHNRRSGFPDLVMWNTIDKKFKVVEVKGPGDRISSKQALWLSRFTSIGVVAELCNVVGIKDVPPLPVTNDR